MGNVKVRYLVARHRSRRPTRYYWVPTKKLQSAGFSIRRLPDTLVEATRQAEQHNADGIAVRFAVRVLLLKFLCSAE